MTTPLTTAHPRTPVRLVVVHPEGVVVYEGRKRLAFSREKFDYTPAEIEKVRVDDYITEE